MDTFPQNPESDIVIIGNSSESLDMSESSENDENVPEATLISDINIEPANEEKLLSNIPEQILQSGTHIKKRRRSRMVPLKRKPTMPTNLSLKKEDIENNIIPLQAIVRSHLAKNNLPKFFHKWNQRYTV